MDAIRRWTYKRTEAVALVGLLALAACGTELDSEPAADNEQTTESNESAAGKGWPDTITYGILPTDDAARLAAIYEPFESYMADCLDHPFEVFQGTNYTAMIEAMRGDDIHIAKFGPFAYILASERAGADALVQPLADPDDRTYTSQFITLESHGIDSLEDLEGENFAFVDTVSTSGHLFPRAHMVEELDVANDDLEDWLGEVVFSGAHDATILSVLNGDVAAGPISSVQWKIQVEEGVFDDHDRIDELMILDETDDIPRTVEAIQGELPEDLIAATEECFVDAVNDESLTEFLEGVGSPAGYFPVEDSAYDVVRSTADSLGLNPEELLD